MSLCYKNEVGGSSAVLHLGEYGLDCGVAIDGDGLHFVPLSYLLIMLLGLLQRPLLLHCRHPQKLLQITPDARVNQITLLGVSQQKPLKKGKEVIILGIEKFAELHREGITS